MQARFWHSCHWLALIFILMLAACVTATPRAYRDATDLPARSPEEVEVYWIPPDFPYRAIGEVSVRACPACNDDEIEVEVRKAVAEIGGNLAINATDAVRRGGAVIVPGPQMATVVPSQRRDLRFLAAIRDEYDEAQPPRPIEPPAGPLAEVSFECEPADVDVFVDGDLIGTCPITRYPLPAGRYTLRIEAPGYVAWTRDITVTAGASTRVRAELKEHP
jgi:hypothetical protein